MNLSATNKWIGGDRDEEQGSFCSCQTGITNICIKVETMEMEDGAEVREKEEHPHLWPRCH